MFEPSRLIPRVADQNYSIVWYTRLSRSFLRNVEKGRLSDQCLSTRIFQLES